MLELVHLELNLNMLSILHDSNPQSSLSKDYIPFGSIPPWMLKILWYPFSTVVAPTPTISPCSQAAMNNEM